MVCVRRLLAGILTVCALSLTATPAIAEGLDQAAAVSNQKQETRMVEVIARMRVQNASADAARNLVLVLPPVVMDQAGTQRVHSVSFVTEPSSTRDVAAGIEATYRVANVAPGQVITIEQIYQVELMAEANLMTEETDGAITVVEGIDPRYLQPEPGIESDQQVIRAEAARVTSDLEGADAKAEAIVRYVSRKLTYNLNSGSRNRGALAGLTTGDGVCSEYAGLFVAMSRASGVPARLVYGWARNTGLNGALDSQTRHVWAEYHDGERWTPVDPTFAIALPLNRVMEFDGLNHVAQDWKQTNISIGYAGRGFLSVLPGFTLSDLPVSVAAVNSDR